MKSPELVAPEQRTVFQEFGAECPWSRGERAVSRLSLVGDLLSPHETSILHHHQFSRPTPDLRLLQVTVGLPIFSLATRRLLRIRAYRSLHRIIGLRRRARGHVFASGSCLTAATAPPQLTSFPENFDYRFNCSVANSVLLSCDILPLHDHLSNMTSISPGHGGPGGGFGEPNVPAYGQSSLNRLFYYYHVITTLS